MVFSAMVMEPNKCREVYNMYTNACSTMAIWSACLGSVLQTSNYLFLNYDYYDYYYFYYYGVKSPRYSLREVNPVV